MLNDQNQGLNRYLASRRKRLRTSAIMIAGIGLIAGLAFWFSVVRDTDWSRTGGASAWAIAKRFLAVDAELFPALGRPALETFMMATLGTLVGLVSALPIAWLGARNLSPVPWLCYPLARLSMTVSRSVHEIVWALLFVSAVGLGAFPGILALGMRSVGFISKVLSEAIENVDAKPIEAIRASGGSRFQIMMLAIVPQLLPQIIGVIIFEWDINIRRATVMGLVGAGGLGLTFYRQMTLYNYAGVTTVLLVVFALVLAGELVSHFARKAAA